MPGIYGSFNFYQDSHKAVESMSAAMHTADRFVQDDFFVDGKLSASRTHLGHVGMSSSPCSYNGVYVWVEGEVYNLEETCSSTRLSGKNFAQALAGAYTHSSLDALLSGIDGYYCAVLYDPRKRKLLLISDRYGMRMLYWYYRENQIAWASEVKGILALNDVDKTVDETSPHCFMDLGYLMGDHTWFEHIKLIEPATVLEFDLENSQFQHRYYWKWSEIKPSNLSFDEAVDELGKRFLKAIERRYNPAERIGVALSGGLDSRAIFAAMNHLYPDYRGYAYTFGAPACDDIEIAKQVVAQSVWRHDVFDLTDTNWFNPRIEKIWDTDGMLDIMHMHGSEFADEVSDNLHINLNGYAGDVVCGGGWLNYLPLDKRATSENLDFFYKKYSNLCNIEDNFYDTAHVEPHLYMNRVRRFTNMGSVNLLSRFEQRKPFFDNELISFIFSLPDVYRLDNRLYSVMLQSFFPKYFREIPWQKTGKPAGIVQHPNFIEKVLQKFGQIPYWLGLKQSNRSYTNYPEWIRDKYVYEQIEAILQCDPHISDNVLGKSSISTYLIPHLQHRADKSNQILRLVTMAVYFKRAGVY
jgi:asparagine synthase (glutamine-hydrolysing)